MEGAFFHESKEGKIVLRRGENPQRRQKNFLIVRFNEENGQKRRIICLASGKRRKEKTMQEYLAGYNRAVENCKSEFYAEVQRAEMEARVRLQEETARAQIELAKRAEIEEICTSEKRQRAEDRANIASLRCLQKTEVVLTNDGEVEICKELFGATKTDRSNFRIVNYAILQSQLQDEEKEVLAIEFVCEGKKKKVFLDTSKLSAKVLNQKFNKAGIHFKFSQRKEAELRENLVIKLQGIAPITVIPESHGWYRDDAGELKFAFPEDQTWEEVKRLI